MSQILVELDLLDAALKDYDNEWFHLISGVDLPIKTQNYIHDYFDLHKGEEFIQFANEEFNKNIFYRYGIYHFFQDKCVRGKKSIWWFLDRVLCKLQLFMHYSRTKNNKIHFLAGANWFSIDRSCAEYVANSREFIQNTFKYTYCCDEVFLQTLIYDSPFYEKCHLKETDSMEANKRLVVWENSTPRIYTMDDFKMLAESDELFARKFAIRTNEERNIAEKVVKELAK